MLFWAPIHTKPHKSKTIFALEVGKGPYATPIKLGVWGESTLKGGI